MIIVLQTVPEALNAARETVRRALGDAFIAEHHVVFTSDPRVALGHLALFQRFGTTDDDPILVSSSVFHTEEDYRGLYLDNVDARGFLGVAGEVCDGLQFFLMSSLIDRDPLFNGVIPKGPEYGPIGYEKLVEFLRVIHEVESQQELHERLPWCRPVAVQE